MESGWSIKQMHLLIMNSRVYQLASSATDTASETASHAAPLSVAQSARYQEVDPNNELLGRFSRRRLDAESLRDTLLLLSGNLDSTMMDHPHPFPAPDKWEYTQHHPFRDSYESNRRTVYLMTARLNARPFFTTFDGADRNASTAVRDNSVTTVQSLYLLNDGFVHEQASAFAARLCRERDDEDARLRWAFELAMGRPPNTDEQTTAAEFLHQIGEKLAACGTPVENLEQESWTSLARALFRTNEFLYVD